MQPESETRLPVNHMVSAGCIAAHAQSSRKATWLVVKSESPYLFKVYKYASISPAVLVGKSHLRHSHVRLYLARMLNLQPEVVGSVGQFSRNIVRLPSVQGRTAQTSCFRHTSYLVVKT